MIYLPLCMHADLYKLGSRYHVNINLPLLIFFFIFLYNSTTPRNLRTYFRVATLNVLMHICMNETESIAIFRHVIGCLKIILVA